MEILVANGVNLDLLGKREPNIYGIHTLKHMEALLQSHLQNLCTEYALEACHLHFFQSNSESQFLERISQNWDGIILNPGAWTHTSLALADRLLGIKIPFVEVHLSNLYGREMIRQQNYTAKYAVGVVQGFGINSYLLGLSGLLEYFSHKR